MIQIIDIILLLTTFIYVLAKRYTYRVLCWFLLSLMVSFKMALQGRIAVAIIMIITTVIVFLLTEVYGLSSEKFWEKMKEADSFTKSKVTIALLLSLIIGAIGVVSLGVMNVELNTFWSAQAEGKSEVFAFSFISIFSILIMLLLFNKGENK